MTPLGIWIRRGWITLCFLLPLMQRGYAQVSSYEELQAAYLYNFAKYIQWPEERPSFIIGVYGERPPLLPILERILKEKKIAGKEIHIKNITSSEEVALCQILYVPREEDKKTSTLVEEVLGKHILLVTEEDRIKKGAMISFVVEEDRLRFKLKREALVKAGLVAKEGLLRLAIIL